MIFTALRLIAAGALTDAQRRELFDALEVAPGARTEGPALDGGVAHRAWTDGTGRRLWVDVSELGGHGWVLSVLYDGPPPGDDVVAGYRRQFRELVDRFGLQLVEVEPPVTADEVYVMTPQPSRPEDSEPQQWPWQHQTLDDVWRYLQVGREAPREVKVAALRGWIAATPLWARAPQPLRHEAEAFLAGA